MQKAGTLTPDLGAVLELLAALARAAFFRRLLAAAACSELQHGVSAGSDAAARGARHVCDAMDLPRPAEAQVGRPASPPSHDSLLFCHGGPLGSQCPLNPNVSVNLLSLSPV